MIIMSSDELRPELITPDEKPETNEMMI